MSLLCGPWADLYLFIGLYCKQAEQFSLYHVKVYQGWEPQQSGPADPQKENGRLFRTNGSSRLKLPPTKQAIVLLSIRDRASRRLCIENESKVASLRPSTEPWFELLVTAER